MYFSPCCISTTLLNIANTSDFAKVSLIVIIRCTCTGNLPFFEKVIFFYVVHFLASWLIENILQCAVGTPVLAIAGALHSKKSLKHQLATQFTIVQWLQVYSHCTIIVQWLKVKHRLYLIGTGHWYNDYRSDFLRTLTNKSYYSCEILIRLPSTQFITPNHYSAAFSKTNELGWLL